MYYFFSTINKTLLTINTEYICYIRTFTESILHALNVGPKKYLYKKNKNIEKL